MIKIAFRLADGTESILRVTPSSSEPWTLHVSGLDDHLRVFRADDLFNALTSLRGEIEAKGGRLLCAGARPNVFPSGMSRSMSGGQKAYVVRLGMPGDLDSLVDIFDPATADQVGTVEEQDRFRREWAASLMENRP